VAPSGRAGDARPARAHDARAQELGCHNINWVTPEHVVPQILEALPLGVDAGLRLPTVYNTSAYDSPESLELMEGVVDVYMPDFKLWSAERSRRYLAKRDHAEVARHSVREMHRQVGDRVIGEDGMARRGLLVRHLVMPGLLDETESIPRFIATELGPGTDVNLMAQYTRRGARASFPRSTATYIAPSSSERWASRTSSSCAGSTGAAARRWDGLRPPEGGVHSSVRTAHRSGNAGRSSVVAR
jgi:uncharacterized Fe-S radical SAM superfamily protein PflX